MTPTPQTGCAWADSPAKCSPGPTEWGLCPAHRVISRRADTPTAELERILLLPNLRECIHWTFDIDAGGYGVMRVPGRATRVSVSRVVLARLTNKPLGYPKFAAHLCGQGARACVSQYHLVWATQEENEAHKKYHR